MSRSGGARSERGFTLLELLVVVLIIGLLTSMAVLGVQGRSDRERLEDEAERLIERMRLGREEAVLQSQSLGLLFASGGYRFLALDDERWRRHQDSLFQPHELPEGMRLAVDIDGIDVELATLDAQTGDETETGAGAREGNDNPDDEPVRPQIFFLASGEILPGFSIRLIGDDVRTEYLIEPGTSRWLELSEQRL